MSNDAQQCRTLWLAVLHEAFVDLRNKAECTCPNPDVYHCDVCGRNVDPWDEHGHCRHSTVDTHRIKCRHRFRSARRLLLGTTRAWREQLEMVCGFAGVDVGKVKARALEALKVRRRDAA